MRAAISPNARSSASWTRKVSRRGHCDATMILVAYRHGLRASEVCDLQLHQIELDQGRLHVRRAKRGIPSIHPIRDDEIRALAIDLPLRGNCDLICPSEANAFN